MNTAVRSTLVGMGAGLMFLLDPGRGARRRALVRDKAIRATRKSRDAYEATRCDLGNRARGVVADLHAVACGGGGRRNDAGARAREARPRGVAPAGR